MAGRACCDKAPIVFPSARNNLIASPFLRKVRRQNQDRVSKKLVLMSVSCIMPNMAQCRLRDESVAGCGAEQSTAENFFLAVRDPRAANADQRWGARRCTAATQID